MIPPLTFLSWVFLLRFELVLFASFLRAWPSAYPPPPLLYFVLLMIYECHELPSHGPMSGCAFRL